MRQKWHSLKFEQSPEHMFSAGSGPQVMRQQMGRSFYVFKRSQVL